MLFAFVCVGTVSFWRYFFPHDSGLCTQCSYYAHVQNKVRCYGLKSIKKKGQHENLCYILQHVKEGGRGEIERERLFHSNIHTTLQYFAPLFLPLASYDGCGDYCYPVHLSDYPLAVPVLSVLLV